MQLSEILINPNDTVRDAVERLEKKRCRVVYVAKNKKLIASVSDGDVRRFYLTNGDANENVSVIAHKNPLAFYENEIDAARKCVEQSGLGSVPIINNNREVVGVLFRNGDIVRNSKTIDMPVVITAGGNGTRLYPYTKILPKALIPIGDIPITEHIINSFVKAGSSEIFMIVNSKKNMIESYYEGIDKDYNLTFIEEDEPLGTGGD